jgi:hypothetical protein
MGKSERMRIAREKEINRMGLRGAGEEIEQEKPLRNT